jgi:hypothetical protein
MPAACMATFTASSVAGRALIAISASWAWTYFPWYLDAIATLASRTDEAARIRPVFIDDADAGIARDEAVEFGRRAAAERTVVVEEGDDRDVAVRVAGDRRIRVVEHALHESVLIRRGRERRKRARREKRHQDVSDERSAFQA